MNILERFEKIKVFVFDIDGVLTNGMLYLQRDGVFLRAMNIKDGYAIQLAIKKGYEVWVLSAGNSEEAKERLIRLGVHQVHTNEKNKAKLLSELIARYNIPSEAILYMGDDMPDIEAMKMCGLTACPSDAADDVRAMALYISSYNGGTGCVRDVIEKTLKINDHWE